MLSADHIAALRSINKAKQATLHVESLTTRREAVLERKDIPYPIYQRLYSFINDANKTLGFKLDSTISEIFFYSIYNKGHKCGLHADTSMYELISDGESPNKVSLVACLAEPELGGTTHFYYSEKTLLYADVAQLKYTVNMKVGDVIVFPSMLFHEVTEIEQGQRETLTFFARGPRLI